MSKSPSDPGKSVEQTPRRILVEELERRIEELEAVDDDTVGNFSGWDWLVCVLGALVVPGLALWWFAG